MSAPQDYPLAPTTQDHDPLLPPQYTDVVDDDSAPLRLGGKSARVVRRSAVTSFALTTSVLLVVILAAPLFLLWRNGVFDDGWKAVLGTPKPDHEVFPTE